MKNYSITILLAFFFSFSHAQSLNVIDVVMGTDSGVNNGLAMHISWDDVIIYSIRNSSGNRELWFSDGKLENTRAIYELGSGQEFIRFATSDNLNKVYFTVRESFDDKLFTLGKIDLLVNEIYDFKDPILHLFTWNGNPYFSGDSETMFSNDALYIIDPSTDEVVEWFIWEGNIRDLILSQYNGTESVIAYFDDFSTINLLRIEEGNTTPTILREFDVDQSGIPPLLHETDEYLMFFAESTDEIPRLFSLKYSDNSFDVIANVLPADINSINSERGTLVHDNKFYFRGENLNDVNSNELYVTDGTSTGTVIIDVNTDMFEHTSPSHLTTYKGKVYFNGDQFSFTPQLYKTDGTQAGTNLAIDASQLGGGNSFTGLDIAVVGDSLVFYGTRWETGEELYISDGTTVGTRVVDLNPGEPNSFPQHFAVTDNLFYFSAFTPDYGRELWVYDPQGILSSTSEFDVIGALDVFPNPISDQIQITFPVAEDRLLQIYNIEGKKVFEMNTIYSEETIDLRFLDNGNYILMARSESEVAQAKLSVVR